MKVTCQHSAFTRVLEGQGSPALQNCNTEVAFVSIRSAVRAAEGHVLSSAVDVGALESTAVNLHVTELGAASRHEQVDVLSIRHRRAEAALVAVGNPVGGAERVVMPGAERLPTARCSHVASAIDLYASSVMLFVNHSVTKDFSAERALVGVRHVIGATDRLEVPGTGKIVPIRHAVHAAGGPSLTRNNIRKADEKQ